VIVLALNAGSSSLKASLVRDGKATVGRASADWAQDPAATLAAVLDQLDGSDRPVDAVAHRVVHGGERFTRHVILDDPTLAAIEDAAELAPLHNAVAVETIGVARARFPDAPHVACFDTAFHASLPAAARRDPIPERWAALGIRRFGFHGLSVEWSVGRAAELLGRPATQLRVVVAHLGSGASVTAADGGTSAWSSMGYTPNDGLMMGTRSGAIDPGIVLDLIRRRGLGPDDVAAGLEHEAGLLGVSGTTSDVRRLDAAARDGDARARLALEMFAARAAAGIAAAATWLPALDALVFTGGIGEHAAGVRRAIVDHLAILGLSPLGDDETGEDRILAGPPRAILRVEAREDLVMARAAERLVAARWP
jgi:acetate kinase